MTIIVESGATKTDWCVISKNGDINQVKTEGINLAVMPAEAISIIIKQAVDLLGRHKNWREEVTDLHYYAAGLIAGEGERVPSIAVSLDSVLKSVFSNAEVEYASDLLAAARAVCGQEPGIATIVGTGSNSCFYDGKKIVKNVRSAGFILGDEGGAARLGRLFMADFLKGLVPESVSKEFAEAFQVDYLTVVNNVYKSSTPSKYLGSFAPWILARCYTSEYINNLVEDNFRAFVQRALSQYDIKNLPVGVVGGFGYASKEILLKVFGEYSITVSKVIKSPIEGLINYYE